MTGPEAAITQTPEAMVQAELVTNALRKNLQRIEATGAAEHRAWRPLLLVPDPEAPSVLAGRYRGFLSDSPANIDMLTRLYEQTDAALDEATEASYTGKDGTVHCSRTFPLRRPGVTGVWVREVVSEKGDWRGSRVTCRNYQPDEPEVLV